jgi:hypothetical protein
MEYIYITDDTIFQRLWFLSGGLLSANKEAAKPRVYSGKIEVTTVKVLRSSS